MCGRYVSASTAAEIARYFDADPPVEVALEPSYNVAPTDDIYVVRDDGGGRKVAPHHWGLVPGWAKTPAVGNKMINARAETLATNGAFKHAFRHRRCLVPADGYYEWRKTGQGGGGKAKQPFFIHRADGQPLAFAGLWEEWRGPDRGSDQHLRSATVITTTPNEAMSTIHDRMPVVLLPSAWDQWLDPDHTGVDALEDLLVPAPDDLLVMHAVSGDVGNVRNQGSYLIEPVEPVEPAQLPLL